MKRQLSDEQFDKMMKTLVAEASADDALIDDITASPTLWWNIQRSVRDEKAAAKCLAAGQNISALADDRSADHRCCCCRYCDFCIPSGIESDGDGGFAAEWFVGGDKGLANERSRAGIARHTFYEWRRARIAKDTRQDRRRTHHSHPRPRPKSSMVAVEKAAIKSEFIA
ncbi:MAG: hypothetical protein IPP63_15945 [Chloracidobacterium sp.]|nr:hypothetical protein [Chloracidobacterium sp.]